MTEPWVIGLVANILFMLSSFFVVSIRMTWKAATTKAEIIAAITDHAKDDEEEFTRVRAEIFNSVHDFGETVASLKEHINGIQLEATRLYVRRDGFYEAMKRIDESVSNMRGELAGSITALRAELRIDLQNLSLKIDTKT